MSSVNKAIIIGNLGADPEVRYLPSGDAVANFSVATTDKWKDKASGEMKEATEWHRIDVFGKLAEICAEYLKKGASVYIEGSIRTRKWEKDGIERYSTSIRADVMRMLGGRREGGSQEGGSAPRSERPASSGQQRPPASKPAGGGFDEMDDDIPF